MTGSHGLADRRPLAPLAGTRAAPPTRRAPRRCLGGGPARAWARLAAGLATLLLAAATAGGAAAPAPAPPAPPTAPDSVNMEFRDTDLPTVLRAICQGAGVDFVLDPAVKGTVTAKLRNTAWESALDIVLRSHSLTAKREGNTLLIAPARNAAPPPERDRVVVKAQPGGTYDLDAVGSDIRSALRELAAAAKLNIVASKDVSGTLTASLHGLRAEEILLALADSAGAVVADKGNVILVSPRPVSPAEAPEAGPAAAAGDAPAAVEIKPLADGRFAVRAEKASVRALVGRLAAASGLNVVASEKVAGTISLQLEQIRAEDALAAIATQAGLEIRPVGGVLYLAPAPPGVQAEAFRLRYAEPKELAEVLKQTVEGAKVAIVAATQMVVVTGSPQQIAAARQLVERVERPPVQVSIETRIIETNLTGDEHLGIEWSDAFQFQASCASMPHTWPFKANDTNSYNPGYDPGDTRGRAAQSPAADTDAFQFGILSGPSLTTVLHMLKTETKSRTLANPTITTVENQQAKINIVTKYPIAQYQVSSETGVLTISGFEYQEFGTILEVTPRVSDGHVIMDIHPEISRQAGVTQFQGAELPVIASQETTTRVRVRDGDTLVIAGLIREDTENTEKKVPWFWRIPLLGRLFRSKRNTVDQRQNLLIFITPHIVGDADFVRDAKLKRQHSEPMPAFGGGDPEPPPADAKGK